MSLLDSAETDTLPKLLQRNADESSGSRPASARRTAASGRPTTWREYHDHVRDFALGLAALGFKRGDKLVGHRRQPPAPLLGAGGRPGAGRRVGAGLPGLDRQGAGLSCSNHAEVVGDRGRGPGAGRQGPVAQGPAARACARRLRGPARHVAPTDDPMLGRSTSVEEAGRRLRPRAPGLLRARDRPRAAPEDVAHDRLHVGHDRHAQGRDAQPRQHDRGGRDASSRSNDVSRGDNWLCYLPMAWVGDVALLARHGLVGRLLRATARRARRRVQRDLRELGPNAMLAPPRIWENMLTGDAGQGRPTPRRSSAACSSISAALAERCEMLSAPTASRSRSAMRLGLRGSASSSSTARCATSSACATRAGATPAARRSGRTRSASSARSASTSSRSTAPPKPAALVACQPDAEANPNTVGRPMPGIEVKIAERGEVHGEGPRRVRGLLQAGRGHARGARPRRLAAAPATPASSINAGHLVIIDRAKDVGKLDRRHAVRAAVHREQAEVQPLHPRGGGVRRTSGRSWRR